ncbi:MAG: fibronectin type III domain-containing protein, partial [Thermoguttaceae bacterium]|nr:fibronectin type III domain-containing protein [Thermoguttaceae bacterium]
MKKKTLEKSLLRLESLENRELLSATTWDNATLADAAVAAETVATLNDANAEAIDLSSAFSAAELDATAEEAKTWLVTSTLDDGSEGTLRYAVENAVAGDTIKFDASLQDATIALSEPIVVDKALTISAYDLYRFEDLPNLIYDVDCAGLALDGQGSTRIFELAEGADLSLIGVKMTNGSICGDWTTSDSLPGELENDDTTFYKEYHGGAVYVPKGAKLSLEACVLSNSRSIGGGGAIAAAGEIRASNTIFEGNHGGAGQGGAIRVFDGFVEAIDCYFRGNTIVAKSGDVYSGGGGAVSANGGVFRSFNTLYSGNKAAYGGAFFVHGGEVYLSNSLVVGNGGIDGNKCSDGGGVNVDSGNLTIVNSTIAGNVVNNYYKRGSGIFANTDAGEDLTVNIYNSIIAENRYTTGGFWGGGSETVGGDVAVNESKKVVNIYGWNNFSSFTGWEGESSGNLTYDGSEPLFTTANGLDYALAEGSRAINGGNVEYAKDYYGRQIEADFIRYVRVIDDKIDIGALESGSVPFYEAIRAPENVAFSGYDAKAGTVVVTWEDKSYAELGFRVEISTDGENWTWAAQVGENVEAATLSGIEPNTTYHVRVRAERDLSDVSEWSEVADFTATARSLAAPVVEAKATSSTEIAFAISEVEGAVGYVYEYSANADFSDATRGEIAEAGTINATGLNVYTKYYFRAYAVGAGANLDSPWSSTSATTQQVVLNPPTPSVSLSETDDSSTLVLSFAAVDNATSYVYRYATSEAGLASAAEVETTTAGSFVISGLQPGQKYYFQAMSVGEGAYLDSAWSAPVSASTDSVDLPAPSVSATTVDESTITFNIGFVANASSYAYEYSTNADFTNATSGTAS